MKYGLGIIMSQVPFESNRKSIFGMHFKKVLNVPLAWQVAFDRPVSDFVPDESTSPSRISVADLMKILP